MCAQFVIICKILFFRLSVTGDYSMLPRHEVTCRLEISDQPEIVISGHLSPVLRNIDSQFEIRRAGKTYMIQHVHDLQGNADRFDATLNWKIKCSPHLIHITAEAQKSGDRVTSQVEAKWDAERDSSKKITLTNTLILTTNAPSVELRAAWWPREFLELNAGAQLTTGGYYNPEMQLKSNATLRSSFQILPEIRLVYNVLNVSPRTTVHSELTYAPGKTIIQDFSINKLAGWKHIEMRYDASTPFAAYRQLRLTHSHTIDASRIILSQSHEAGKQRGGIEIDCSTPSIKNIACGITVRTPHEGYEELSLSVRNDDNGRKVSSNIRAALNDQVIDIMFAMDTLLARRYYLTTVGEITITTPITGYRRTVLSWNHKNTETTFKCHHKLEFKGRSSLIDIDAVNTVDSRRNIILSALVKSPLIDDIRVAFQHVRELSSMRNIATTGSMHWGQNKQVSLSSELDLVSSRSGRSSISATSSFEGFERLAFEANVNNNNGVVSKTMRFEWAPRKVITVVSRVDMQALPEVDASFTLTTPFEDVENVALQVSNREENGLWTSSASLQFEPRNTVTVIIKLGLENLKKVSIDLKTPFTEIRSLEFDLHHIGSLRNFDTRASFECLPSLGTYSMASRLNADNMMNIIGNLDIESPVPEYRYIRLVVSHVDEEVMTTEVTFEMPSYTASFTETINFNSWKDLSTNTVVEYAQGQTIQAEFIFNALSGLNLEGRIRSPYMEDILIEITHSGSSANFESALNFESPKGNIAGNARYTLNNGAISGSATLNMPIFSVPIITATIETSGELNNNMQLNAEITYGGKAISVTTRLNILDAQKTVSIVITTPFTGYDHINCDIEISSEGTTKTGTINLVTSFTDDIRMTIQHEGDLQIFNSRIETTYKGQTYSAIANVDVRSRQKRGSLTLNLPIEYSKIVINMSHEGFMKKFQSTASLTVNREFYSAKMEFDMISPEKILAIATSTPDGDSVLNLNCGGRPTKFYANMKIVLSEEIDLTLTSTFDIESTTKTVSVELNSTTIDFPTGSFDLSYKGSLAKFDGTVSLQLGGTESYTIAVDLDLIASLRQLSLSATRPIDGFESSSLTITCSGSMVNFRSTIEASIMRNTISTAVLWDITDPTKTISISLETPFRGYETSSLKLVYVSDSMEYTSTIEAVLMRKTFALSTEVSLRNLEKTISVTIVTPIPGYERSSISCSQQGDISNFRTEITLNINGQRVMSNVAGRIEDETKALTIGLESPIMDITIEVMHSGGLLNNRAQASVIVDGARYSFETELAVNRGDATSSMVLSTPHEILRRFAIQLSHSGKKLYYRDSVTIELNDKSYSAGTLFRWMDKTSTLKMNAEVILDGTSYSVNVQHRGSLSDMEDSFTVYFGNQRVQGTSQIRIGRERVEASAVVITPFSGIRNIEASINHFADKYGEFSSSG